MISPSAFEQNTIKTSPQYNGTVFPLSPFFMTILNSSCSHFPDLFWAKMENSCLAPSVEKLSCYLVIFPHCSSSKDPKRERERQTDVDLLFHWFMHSLVYFLCALTRDRTCNLGISGRCSNQWSYLVGQGHDRFLTRTPISIWAPSPPHQEVKKSCVPHSPDVLLWWPFLNSYPVHRNPAEGRAKPASSTPALAPADEPAFQWCSGTLTRCLLG